jgi:hypothetical protein
MIPSARSSCARQRHGCLATAVLQRAAAEFKDPDVHHYNVLGGPRSEGWRNHVMWKVIRHSPSNSEEKRTYGFQVGIYECCSDMSAVAFPVS